MLPAALERLSAAHGTAPRKRLPSSGATPPGPILNRLEAQLLAASGCRRRTRPTAVLAASERRAAAATGRGAWPSRSSPIRTSSPCSRLLCSKGRRSVFYRSCAATQPLRGRLLPFPKALFQLPPERGDCFVVQPAAQELKADCSWSLLKFRVISLNYTQDEPCGKAFPHD